MIGQKLGSFQITEKLGSGAMGVVYLGVSEMSGKRREAAVKVLSGEVAQKGTAYERFKREVEILQQFRHPNIVRFLAVGRYQGTSYFAMEYVKGTTLEKVIHERGELPWQEVVQIGIQICDALHYAHQHGVVHRDLKPSNLLVSEEGQVKLTDFGIAKDLDATALTATGRTLGTAAYMAPEQIRGTPEVSHKTDLYALGIVLYQMLTGQIPFLGPTAIVLMHQHLTEAPPRPSAKLAEIPVALDELIVKLMAKEPADRPWDAAAVGMLLTELRDKVERGEPVPMVWSGVPKPLKAKPKTTRKTKAKAASWSLPSLETPWVQTGLLVLALVALLGLVGYFVWPSSAAYLYHQAEAMMASNDSADWVLAEKDYIDELDRRFPSHPYQQQTRAWRDRILLNRAERRALVLENPNLASLSKPKTDAERMFVEVYQQILKDCEEGIDIKAVQLWRDMASALPSGDKESRGWVLLAEKRAEELDREIAERRKEVERKLAQAQDKIINGYAEDGTRIRRAVVEQYSKYPELADLIAQTKARLGEEERPAPPKPSPAPPKPSESPAPAPPTPDSTLTPTPSPESP
jgi:serine/threonine protein kinase